MDGPDLYLELDESILNEVLAAGWQTGLATGKGKLTFVKDVPAALVPYAELDWRVTLNGEPLVSCMGTDQIFVHLDAQLELLVLTIVPLTFDLAFHSIVNVNYSSITNSITFTDVAVVIDRLDIRNDVRVSDAFLDTLNHMLASALFSILSTEPFVKTLKDITFQIPLPSINNNPSPKLPITLSCCKILNGKRLALALMFQEETSITTELHDVKSSAPVFFHLHLAAINNIYNLWWSAMDWSKPIVFNGTLPLNADVFIEKSRAFLTRLVTLGFLQRENDIKNMNLNYEGKLYLLSQPLLDFQAPNKIGAKNIKLKVDFNIEIHADVDETLFIDTSSVISDKLTPWKDDIEIKHSIKSKDILHLSKEFSIDMEQIAATVSVNSEGEISLKAQKADLKLDFGDEWYQNLPESLINGLVKLFNQKIIDHLPALVISPSVVLKDVAIQKLSPLVVPQSIIVHSADTALFGQESLSFETRFDVVQLNGPVPVPGYIVNIRSGKIHRITCPVVRDIRAEHLEGYYVLHEALALGYHSCKNCLKGADVI
ncbi:MAG: hypothetical protein WBI07_15305 [Mobilitalea sp.]